MSQCLKPAAYRMSPVAGANASPSKVSRVSMMNRQAHPPLQEKGKEKSMLQESLSATSRREMLHLTAASVGVLSLLLPASAEAAARNASMKQKILKKLEELRQNFGLSKPKDEGEENKKEAEKAGKSKVNNGTEEANPKPEDEGDAKPKAENTVKETTPEGKDEKKLTGTAQESKAVPIEGAVVPALPGIINGKTVEAALQ